MSNAQQIAQTIRSQIIAGIGAREYMCWGARGFIALPASDTKGMLGGLQFRVSGLKFAGLVNVWLHGSDTYTAEFVNRARRVVKSTSDLYCEDIGKYLNREIEHD